MTCMPFPVFKESSQRSPVSKRVQVVSQEHWRVPVPMSPGQGGGGLQRPGGEGEAQGVRASRPLLLEFEGPVPFEEAPQRLLQGLVGGAKRVLGDGLQVGLGLRGPSVDGRHRQAREKRKCLRGKTLFSVQCTQYSKIYCRPSIYMQFLLVKNLLDIF